MAFCLCYHQIQVLFKMLYKINDGITLVEKIGSYLTVLEAFIHPDRAIHFAGAALSMFNAAFLLTMAIQLFEMEQYVSENLF